MQIKLFTVSIGDEGKQQEELNVFLRGNKVLDVSQHIVQNERGAYWCFCVRYIEGGTAAPNNRNLQFKEKVDYKTVLDEATFKVFARLREIRKQIANDDAIPAFAVFTDEELSEIARDYCQNDAKHQGYWRKENRTLRRAIHQRPQRMKRTGYLYNKIADMDNLRLAYCKAKRGKSGKPDVLDFEAQLDFNLLRLREQLLSGKVTVGNYHYFKVFDPKERQICAAAFSERVLHHALMNGCHPYFERFQVFDSYASRIGKGTYKAIDRAKAFGQQYEWYLKLDVRKYFDSVSHQVLKGQLFRLFKDPHLLKVLYAIIDTYEVEPGKGVPIGNLTSQYFANHYLAVADHYVKEQLKIPAYVRYMDDMVLWHNNKAQLLEIGKKFEDFINNTLQLDLKPFCLNGSAKGLPFLGYILFPNRILLSQRSRSRFYQKLKQYERNYQKQYWNERDYQRCLIPLLAFTERADAGAFRRQVLRAVSAGY